ncbi:hypothetical protein EMPS_07564 [Entomortierella parvispora]|uniref:Uncharacterized protein n=1 Tax=Entomortierella parvispora TaxID=205924 RepID=A0A9P3LY96_9FUNG|nr:hypothetical protein EMPS_07564 [Entomortierella parvispora]
MAHILSQHRNRASLLTTKCNAAAAQERYLHIEKKVAKASPEAATPKAANASMPPIPNKLLYPYFAKAWDQVAASTVRNCFAHVPTTPAEMSEGLRVNVVDTTDEELELLKQELAALFPSLNHKATINSQTSFDVLTYLKSCEGLGSSPRIMEAIKAVSLTSDFSHFSVSPEDMEAIYQDDPDDPDYDLDNLPVFPRTEDLPDTERAVNAVTEPRTSIDHSTISMMTSSWSAFQSQAFQE